MIMLRCLLVACLLLLLSGPAGAFSTTLDSDSVTLALADDGDQDISISFPDSLPFSGRDTAADPPSARPGALSDGIYELSNSRFDIFFNDMRQSGSGDSTSLLQGEILFSVDEEVLYDLSGFLQVSDFGGDPGDVVLFVSLIDTTDDDVLFSQVLFSQSTSDQNFQLGISNGDTENELLGSLTGSIAAGNVYELEYAAQIANDGGFSSGGANAFGTVELRLIPEPATALLLVAGLAGLAAQRRRAS